MSKIRDTLSEVAMKAWAKEAGVPVGEAQPESVQRAWRAATLEVLKQAKISGGCSYADLTYDFLSISFSEEQMTKWFQTKRFCLGLMSPSNWLKAKGDAGKIADLAAKDAVIGPDAQFT